MEWAQAFGPERPQPAREGLQEKAGAAAQDSEAGAPQAGQRYPVDCPEAPDAMRPNARREDMQRPPPATRAGSL